VSFVGPWSLSLSPNFITTTTLPTSSPVRRLLISQIAICCLPCHPTSSTPPTYPLTHPCPRLLTWQTCWRRCWRWTLRRESLQTPPCDTTLSSPTCPKRRRVQSTSAANVLLCVSVGRAAYVSKPKQVVFGCWQPTAATWWRWSAVWRVSQPGDMLEFMGVLFPSGKLVRLQGGARMCTWLRHGLFSAMACAGVVLWGHG